MPTVLTSWPARAATAVLGGLLLYASFPPRPLWWLAPLAVALLGLTLHRTRPRAAFLYGLLFGTTFFLLHLHWLQDFLGTSFGPWPWLALSVLMALFIATAAALMPPLTRLPVPALWYALLFCLQESARGRFPLNGFPWGKLAFGQPDGPFISLAAVGGAPLVSFAVALTGFALARTILRLTGAHSPATTPAPATTADPTSTTPGAASCTTTSLNRPLTADATPRTDPTAEPLSPRPNPIAETPSPGLNPTATPARPDRFRARAAALAVLPLVLALTTWPFLGTAPDTGTRTVAIVQGNAPNVGIDLLNEAPTLRRNHLQASRELATAIRTGTVPKPDLVVWPESATQVNGPDPTLDAAVADLGAPTLIGSLYRLPTGQRENAVVAWDPATGEGPRYAKQELVPFSEYIPFRTIALWFTPFAATPDLKAGNTPGLFTIAGAKIGVGICYEVAYDAPLRAAAQQGAELLVVPTNNAWFGQGEMTYQQLAMARLRAVEHDRAVIVAATSGVSAIVQPDGTVTKSLEMYTAGSLTAQVPLRTTTTLSDRLGGWAEPTMLLLTAAALTVAALRSRAG